MSLTLMMTTASSYEEFLEELRKWRARHKRNPDAILVPGRLQYDINWSDPKVKSEQETERWSYDGVPCLDLEDLIDLHGDDLGFDELNED